MSLGCNIKKYRKEKGYTQKVLSDMSNISRTYLADVEKDRYNPSLDTLKSIANALNISINNLLEDNSIECKTSELIQDDFKIMIEKLKKLNKKDREKIEKMIDIFLENN